MLVAALPTAMATALALPMKSAEPAACGQGMVLVEGSYCPEVEHRCKQYMDPPGRYEFFRCAEYEKPARCLSRVSSFASAWTGRSTFRRARPFPPTNQSWTDGDRTCRSLGKRMCMESEYNFACEGEEMRPYPYGWARDSSACNADHYDVVDTAGKLRDMRVPADAYPRCESPFGIKHLAGNLEEFVTIDGSNPVRPAMKGAYWQPSRNFCRAAQTAHDSFYHGTETGFRCCSDAKK